MAVAIEAGDCCGRDAAQSIVEGHTMSRQASWSSLLPSDPHKPLLEQRARDIPPLPAVLDSGSRFRPPRFADLSSYKPELLQGISSDVLNGRNACAKFGRGILRPLALTPFTPGTDDSAISSSAASSSTPTAAAADSAASTDCGSSGGKNSLRVGVILGGERAMFPMYPVNVIEGIVVHLQKVAPGSTVVGFADGPQGLLAGKGTALSIEDVAEFRNQCGWHFLTFGSCSEGGFSAEDRAAEAATAAVVCTSHQLDALVVIAGPKDLSWAAALAFHFQQKQHHTAIIGVPYSKNSNLHVPKLLSVTLGFDSARRLLSEVTGNIFTDVLSSRKYWHFIRIGEDALTLEVALVTRATCTVRKGNRWTGESLKDTVRGLEEVIERRRANGHHSGVVLLSRELVEFLPEMEKLRAELAEILGSADGHRTKPPSRHDVERRLKQEDARELFKRLPRVVQMSLITRRDAKGLPLSTDLEAERILGRFVQQNLKASQVKHLFAPRFHNLELMAYAPLPTTFDCAYGYALGQTAAALAVERRNFYVASCADMHLPVSEWQPVAFPFDFLCCEEQSAVAASADNPCFAIPKKCGFIHPKLEEAYEHFKQAWVEKNAVRSVGPLQFGSGGDVGPKADRPFTLLADNINFAELMHIIQPIEKLPLPVQIGWNPTIVRDVRVFENLSTLQQRRIRHPPNMPPWLKGSVHSQDELLFPQACSHTEGLAKSFPHTYGKCNAVKVIPDMLPQTGSVGKASDIHRLLGSPRRVGIVFGSNQAPGFHTVVAGVFDCLAAQNPPGELVGFFGGFEGMIHDHSMAITADVVNQYRNLGGQDMLCHSSDLPRCSTYKNNLTAVTSMIRAKRLDGLIVAGNPEAQVDAAFITEVCADQGLHTSVVGVPISINCDFPFVQQSVGYDSVCHTLSAYIGQIGSLALATNRLWIFVRLMGDAWSHIAVQCTLQAHPHIVLLSGSELHGQTLPGIVRSICDLIVTRHRMGNNCGVVVLPLGFVQDVTELRLLFSEVHNVMEHGIYDSTWDSIPAIASKLEPRSAALFDQMPRDVQYEICFAGRELRTNKIHLASISTDRLILRFVEIELERRKDLGLITEDFFHGVCHPMLHHARSSIPSNFDCNLAYTLGWSASTLLCQGKTGLVVHGSNLQNPVNEWRISAIPMTSLLKCRYCEETEEYIITPALQQLLRQRGIKRPLKFLPPMEERTGVYRGPMQFWGEAATDPSARTTWFMESMPIQDPTAPLLDIAGLCGELHSMMAQARAESTLYAVNSILTNAVSILDVYKGLDETSRRSAQSLADVPMDAEPEVWRTKGERSLNIQTPSPQRVPLDQSL